MPKRSYRPYYLYVLLGLLWISRNLLASNVPLWSLNLNDLENQSLQTAENLKRLTHETTAETAKVKSIYTQLLPRLTLEGTYRYQSTLPRLSLPHVNPVAMGDHHNYSVGPTLTWTALDFGATYATYQSQRQQLQAKQAEQQQLRRQILLNVRLAYYQVLAALAEQRLLLDALKLAESQYLDIQNRQLAGVASKLDLLLAHKEVLARAVNFKELETKLSLALNDLQRLTSNSRETTLDFTHPLDSTLATKLPHPLPAPTILIVTKDLGELEKIPEIVTTTALSKHPELERLNLQAASLDSAAKATHAALYPKIQLQARASFDYPNGPVLEHIQQNIVGVVLSLPLLEFSRTLHQRTEQNERALALRVSREQLANDLTKDIRKISTSLQALKEESSLLASVVKETTAIASLIYDTYRHGQTSFLEVEAANLKALETKVQLTRKQVALLSAAAWLQSLSNDD